MSTVASVGHWQCWTSLFLDERGMSDEDGSIYNGKASWAEDGRRRQFLLRRLCPSDAVAELWLAIVGLVVGCSAVSGSSLVKEMLSKGISLLDSYRGWTAVVYITSFRGRFLWIFWQNSFLCKWGVVRDFHVLIFKGWAGVAWTDFRWNGWLWSWPAVNLTVNRLHCR